MADLAKRLPTTEFSKIAGVAGLGDEEGLEFMRGLYQATIIAKDNGDWSRVERFIDEWETKLISRARPGALRYEDTPWQPFTKPLKESKVALIGTGGIYIKAEHEPFNTDGDTSFRVIPSSTPAERLGISHTHYDTTGAETDPNVVFPIDRLREMAAAGTIGSVAETAYGFMGYIVRDDVETLLNETAPEVAGRIVADGADAAIIGTT
jgi:D-proline reductase (dithiol) PrdB